MVRSSPPLLAAATALTALAAPSFVTAAELPETVTALIDDSVDPCEDFYQYACGTWLDSTTVPEDEQAWAYSFSTIKDNIDAVLKDVLSNGDKPIVGDLWKSCMDLDSINALGSDPLQDALQRIAAAETNEELFELAGEFSRVGSSFITAFSVNANPSDATVNQLSASYAPLTIDVQYYADDALLDQYAQTMVDYAAAILDLSGWFDLLDNSGSISYPTDESESDSGGNYAQYVKDDSSDSSATDESTHKNHLHLRIHHSDDRRRLGESGNEPINASVVLDFEYSLVTIMLLSDDLPEGELYLPVTLKDAVELYPLSIGSFLTGMDLYEDATSLTNDSVLAFWSQAYYAEVEKFVNELDLPTLKTYLAYTYINSQVPYLGEDFLDASFELFQRALVGQEVKSERDEICISKLIKLVPDQVGLYYYEAQFGPDQEKLAEDLVDHLKAAMKTHIDDVEWLDDETTKQAQDKLSKIVDLIGHSKEESTLDVTLDPTTFFANAQSINDAKARDYASEVYNPVDRSKWLLSAATVNAYYTPLANQIVFPAGILQPPMFNASAHPAQNYGSIGMVIGHEITHGFDSSGREYDGNGNHVDWWSEKTSAAFDERTDCFIEQYNAYAVPGENGSTIGYVNGNLTVTENIADNGGIRVAYDAFVDYLDSGDAVIPDGVTDYDDDDADKLFFLAFAQTWCEKDRDASLVQQITTNEHSPTRWRVNGAVSNSDAFSKVFNCPATATLNPTNKCVIW